MLVAFQLYESDLIMQSAWIGWGQLNQLQVQITAAQSHPAQDTMASTATAGLPRSATELFKTAEWLRNVSK
jgi:hypothetical protein